ncbi:MAG TPA: flagellar hook protein [Actinomycetes bacterium]|nr:flagellar hook protein [Actinomycetes bacterium]
MFPSRSNLQEQLRLRAELRRAEQFGRNADDGLARLGAAGEALTFATALLRRAHDLIAGACGTPLGAAERQATAREVEALRARLLRLANTGHLGRPLFGGTAAVEAAFAADGTYLGNSGAGAAVERTLARGVSVRVNLDGLEVFGPDASGPGLLQALARTIRHLDAGERDALPGDLNSLETAQARMRNALAKVGALHDRVQTMRDRAGQRLTRLERGLAEVEDVDLPATIVDLQVQQTTYQAALSATAKVVQRSLADFLR